MTLNPSNSSNLEQLALKGLTLKKTKQKCVCVLNAVSRMLISTLMELTVYHFVPTDWKRFPGRPRGLGWLVAVTT